VNIGFRKTGSVAVVLDFIIAGQQSSNSLSKQESSARTAALASAFERGMVGVSQVLQAGAAPEALERESSEVQW
jgi:hypothetical protein